jgi:hypothetical protein
VLQSCEFLVQQGVVELVARFVHDCGVGEFGGVEAGESD